MTQPDAPAVSGSDDARDARIGAFRPGPMTSRQRDLIGRASEFPLESFRVAVGEWQALNGLVARGLMVERHQNTFELTDEGRLVAEAIERLRS